MFTSDVGIVALSKSKATKFLLAREIHILKSRWIVIPGASVSALTVLSTGPSSKKLFFSPVPFL